MSKKEKTIQPEEPKKEEVKEVKENIIKPKKKYKKRVIVVFIALVISIIALYISFRGSYLEIKEIGEEYISIYWQNLKFISITAIINFILVYCMVYITNIRIKVGLKEFFDNENKTMPKFLNKTIAFCAAIIVTAFTSKFIMQKAMLCFNSAEFGITDPNFGLDIGFFVFQKPFIELLLWYFIISVIILLVYRVIYYITTFNVFFDGVDKKTVKNSKLVKQITNSIFILSILLAGFVVLKAQDIGNSRFLSLNNDNTTYYLYGAGFIDSTVKLWGFRGLALVIILSVYKAIKRFKQDRTRNMIGWMAVVPLYLVLLFIVMAGAQAIFIDSNEYNKERTYIEANIRATKRAYGIDVNEITLEDEQEEVTSKDIAEYRRILNNIAIIDSDIVLKDLNAGQTAKGYYSYRTSQIGKYNIDGKETLVYVSPREIVNGIGTYDSKTYENTHGYGAIISSATTLTDSGNVNNIQKDFENIEKEVVPITEPRIYYGLETNDTVVTNNGTNKEFDYPVLDSSEAENQLNEYNGKSGLSLNFIDRMIIAIKEGDVKLAFSGNVTNKSKILINRNIIKRAKTIMPYLKYDENPYTVISEEGRIIWVLDAYTISNNYPYSQKTTLQETPATRLQLNYIRNSVKVLIDSYDGTIKFYITDRTDPIAMAYYNIYPGLFEDINEKIPEDISVNFVYPKYLYDVQANMICRYHNIRPDVLYRGDDIWDIATHNTGKVLTKTGVEQDAYYTMVKANGAEKLGLILPYTPYGKQNLISYIIGENDSDGNNVLTIYKYPANSNILGPMQLDTKIEEDEIISREVQTLNVTGTKMTRNMIIVPLNNTILYVEPIFTQYLNEKTSLPTLKKVIVASGTKVAIGDDIKEALTNLVSQYAVNIEIENTDTTEELIEAIIKANRNLKASNSSSDWEMIGKDVKKLQELITKLEILVEEENQKKLENEMQNNAIINNTANNITTNSI